MFENKYIAKLKPYKLASHKVWELNDDEILKFTGHGLRENFNFEVKFGVSLQNLIPNFGIL